MRIHFSVDLIKDGKQYTRLVTLDILPNRKPFFVELLGEAEKRIVLIRFNDEVFAVSDICPHQHRQSLHNGYIENASIVCPEHGWAFDIRTGQNTDKTTGMQRLETYEVVVENNYLYLRIDNLKRNERWKYNLTNE
jgi:nitrite reductase/ring-hydroxylating ferredoxin subunit